MMSTVRQVCSCWDTYWFNLYNSSAVRLDTKMISCVQTHYCCISLHCMFWQSCAPSFCFLFFSKRCCLTIPLMLLMSSLWRVSLRRGYRLSLTCLVTKPFFVCLFLSVVFCFSVSLTLFIFTVGPVCSCAHNSEDPLGLNCTETLRGKSIKKKRNGPFCFGLIPF